MSFGEQVRRRREALNLTQIDVAEKTGWSQARISRIERNVSAESLDLSEVRELAKALELEPMTVAGFALAA